jgi:hypothetical protein
MKALRAAVVAAAATSGAVVAGTTWFGSESYSSTVDGCISNDSYVCLFA